MKEASYITALLSKSAATLGHVTMPDLSVDNSIVDNVVKAAYTNQSADFRKAARAFLEGPHCNEATLREVYDELDVRSWDTGIIQHAYMILEYEVSQLTPHLASALPADRPQGISEFHKRERGKTMSAHDAFSVAGLIDRSKNLGASLHQPK